MKFALFLILMCCTFACISSQDCSIDGDFACVNNDVHICLNSETDGHALMITCGDGLTCNIQKPVNGCQSTSPTTDDSTSTARGICADNCLKQSKSSCQIYHKCINGKMNTYTCPKNTCYSYTKAACIPGTCLDRSCVPKT